MYILSLRYTPAHTDEKNARTRLQTQTREHADTHIQVRKISPDTHPRLNHGTFRHGCGLITCINAGSILSVLTASTIFLSKMLSSPDAIKSFSKSLPTIILQSRL